MFIPDKKELLRNLRKLQRGICVYNSEEFCDCKFGATNLDKMKGGEETGCPEVRTVILLLENMTEDEYRELAIRKIVRNKLPFSK